MNTEKITDCILIIITVMLLMFTIGLAGCSTINSASGQRISAADGGETANENVANYRELADYLRRIPGVHVTGAGNNIHVQIRGTSSFNADTRPLYVVDGQTRGTSYAEVSRDLVMSEVKSVRVLTDGDAAAYGVRGANGVILIELK